MKNLKLLFLISTLSFFGNVFSPPQKAGNKEFFSFFPRVANNSPVFIQSYLIPKVASKVFDSEGTDFALFCYSIFNVTWFFKRFYQGKNYNTDNFLAQGLGSALFLADFSIKALKKLKEKRDEKKKEAKKTNQ